LHKDDKKKHCSSENCVELRKMSDVAHRIELLNENKDCHHCCGDHKADNCSKKDRICGGIKEGRGCSKQYKLHELICSEAKLCMMVLHNQGTTVSEDDDGVVLCVMNVRAPKG
jgi:hypothetical protein